MHRTQKAFSLVELLVAFGILAIIVALVVPRYTGLQYGTNLRVAEQQVDAVRKGVIAWSSSQASLTAVSTAYGSSTAISETAWNDIVANYLDPSFASRLKPNIESNTVTYFTTNEMLNALGGAVPAQNYGNTSTPITQPSVPQISGKNPAYGVIFWPTDINVRRNNTPAVVLFAPKP